MCIDCLISGCDRVQSGLFSFLDLALTVLDLAVNVLRNHLGADHGGALGDAAERLPEVAAPVHERHVVLVLVDVVHVIGRRENLEWARI